MKTKNLALAAALMCSSSAFGATVKHVNKKKKLVDVELDEGEKFEKGAAVCFFNDAGDKGECGTVTRVKASVVQVKVKAPKKVKSGMTMKADEASASDDGDEASGSGSGSSSGSASDDDEKPVKKAKAKKSTAAPKGPPFRLVGYYGLAVLTPAKYNKVAYAPPETSTPTSLWATDKAVSSASVGFGAEIAIPLGGFALVPGARYRTFTPSLIDSDFDKGKVNPYISTEEKATAIGAYVDFQFMRINATPAIGINLLGGLDLDMSTVTLKSTKKSEAAGFVASEAASATSKLSVVSLRLGADTDIMALKILGGRLGFTAMVPLAAFGAKFSGKVAEERGLSGAAADDLKLAIGHKKSSVGLEVQLGGVLAP